MLLEKAIREYGGRLKQQSMGRQKIIVPSFKRKETEYEELQ